MVLLTSLTDEAKSGDPTILGGIVALALIALFGYATYWSWTRSGEYTGLQMWAFRGAAVITGMIAISFVVSFILQIAAVLGLL